MNAGIWIDHRKAVVVTLGPADEHLTVVESNVEKHAERTGDRPMQGRYEALQVPADDARQRALTGELNAFYDAVIAALGNAESLILFGPGEAKTELGKRLEHLRYGGRVLAVEAADKLSDRQVAARVRDYFAGPRSPLPPKSGRPNAGLQGKDN